MFCIYLYINFFFLYIKIPIKEKFRTDVYVGAVQIGIEERFRGKNKVFTHACNTFDYFSPDIQQPFIPRKRCNH